MAEKAREKPVLRYTKDSLVKSRKFRQFTDVLAIVLDEKRDYSIEETQNAIDMFLNKKVINETVKGGK